MINVAFKKGEWEDCFDYAYNERWQIKSKFTQESDCVVNARTDKMPDGFEWVTVVTKQKYGVGTKVNFTCSFEEYGAPLITLLDSMKIDADGDYTYSNCHELVVWKNGLNIFDIFEVDGTIKWNKLLADTFPLAANEKHELCLEFMEKYVRATIGEHSVLLRIENLPETFYIGFTACENINRLYSAKIE